MKDSAKKLNWMKNNPIHYDREINQERPVKLLKKDLN